MGAETGRVIQIDDDKIWTVAVQRNASVASSSVPSSIEETESVHEPWSRADIFRLFDMAKNGKRYPEMAEAVGRSVAAVKHAMRKMIIQQCVFHEADDVAAMYHMDVYDLHRILAPRKYYVPIDYRPAAEIVANPPSHVVPMTRSYPSWCIWAFVFMALPIIAMQPFVADFKP